MSLSPQLGQPPDNSPVIAAQIPRVTTTYRCGEPHMADIEVTQHVLFKHRHYWTYKWIGKPWWPVRLSRYYIHEDLGRLPWKLRPIGGYDYLWGDYAMYMREDGLLVWTARWTALRHWIADRLMWITTRLILTAMVWGLAWVPEGVVPSWSHIGQKRGQR